MAIVRGADPADLTLSEARDQARSARGRYLRRWLPIGIGLLMAAAMIAAPAPPNITEIAAVATRSSGACWIFSNGSTQR